MLSPKKLSISYDIFINLVFKLELFIVLHLYILALEFNNKIFRNGFLYFLFLENL